MIRRIVDRLTGREGAALRYQRDAHAEEAGRERQARMAAERERDTFRTALRTMIGVAKQWERDHDAAVTLLQRLATERDEHALADALTWLHARAPVRGATEQEGSRGGLAWMPGEALPDE